MLNYLLRPLDPMIAPNCLSYNFEIIQTMCVWDGLFKQAFPKCWPMAAGKCLWETQTYNPHRNINVQGFVQEYICGRKMFCDAFATTKAVLLFRLVVIKLMLGSVQNNTCESLIKQTDVSSGQVRPARQWRARFRAQAQKHNCIPQWPTQNGCCISPTSPVSGRASLQHGLDIAMAWSSSHLEWPRSGVYLAGSIQNMVGPLFTTPLECGTIFRNIAWASLDQKNICLATSTA